MAVDTPAKIAVIGAGPMGVEAALYARFLGYEVELFEQGEVGAALLTHGDEPMEAPFGQCRSPLGLAALRAQSDEFNPPDDAATLTAVEYRQHYLLPLAESDLVIDSLRLRTPVIGIVRLDAQEQPSEPAEESPTEDGYIYIDVVEYAPFQLTLQNSQGEISHSTAQVVIDCSGRDNPHAAAMLAQLNLGEYGAEDSPVEQLPLVSPEPNFYRLGSRRAGKGQPVSIAQGLRQIRDLFAVIGDRANLDLYANQIKLG